MKYLFILSLIIGWFILPMHSQQLPLTTQFRTNSFIVNPAIPVVSRIVQNIQGEFDILSYKHAAGFSYRDQWWALGKERPRTYSAYYQFYGSRPSRKVRHWDFWVGAYFMSDKVGPTSNTGGYITASLHKDFGVNQHIHFGLSLGFLQYGLDINSINFGSQGEANDPVLMDGNDNFFYADPGLGIYYTNDHMFAGFSIPKIVIGTGDGRRDNIHHYYAVFGTVVRDWGPFNLIEASAWFRWVRHLNPHTDIGVRFQPRTNFPVWAGISLDNTFAVRLNAGLLTSLSENIDLQLGISYTNRVSFFNELGGISEISNSFLFK